MIATEQRRARFASELIGSEDDPAPCGKKSYRVEKTIISAEFCVNNAADDITSAARARSKQL